MSPPTISVSRLRKSFGAHLVLDDLDFAVAKGEIFALLGPNGAGKTTVINILTTLAKADSGTATVAGYDTAGQAKEVQRRISVTGQAAAVDEALSATENLIMFCRLAGMSARAARGRTEELLAHFGLTEAAPRLVRTFSGGMRRRLDLALSFVTIPEVLFLDEPTTGLDTRSRREFWEVVRAVAHAGTTVLLTTQYLEEADQLADRIAVLHNGRIAAVGTPADLKRAVGTSTLEVRDADDRVIREIPTDGTGLGVRHALETVGEVATGSLTLRHPTLDDVFLALTAPDDGAALTHAPKEPA